VVNICRTNAESFLPHVKTPPIAWCVSDTLIPYEVAVAKMEARVEAIIQGMASECVWLLEHPALYTSGTSAQAHDLVPHTAALKALPVYQTGRGGQYTYHGPKQRIAYVMLDLRRRKQDIRCYVSALESWLIETLNAFDIHAQRRTGRVGVWIEKQDAQGICRDYKIAALGIRLRKWVSFHGISLNVSPDLSHFSGIVPCGIKEHGVTSFADLGLSTGLQEVDTVLQNIFCKIFGDIQLKSDAEIMGNFS
jgi:lipoyl(octanoyl) transferase